MRGTVCVLSGSYQKFRITPACAGNSLPSPPPTRGGEDHPRVCGEQISACAMSYIALGSPPRVRGTVHGGPWGGKGRRITPACAGNSALIAGFSRGAMDHPRVCGEQSFDFYPFASFQGSPPRVRGTVYCIYFPNFNPRITPACAGNRLFTALAIRALGDHPRVCGEQSICPCCGGAADGSPPRVRGTDVSQMTRLLNGGITPACAGNR